ncbi:MAG: large-conductance mechanosensitive channel protein MscL [Bacillota bacterium]|nr:large-conductance mechanosensitive channel protein MscL [Bacillota bacterium]
MLKEFKDFAMKGNVVDLAVGVIIGGAFGKIVSSLVNDIIMPVLGLVLGGMNLSDRKLPMHGINGKTVSLNYGMFIQTTIDFLIIAFSIFIIIKAINRFNKKKEEKPAEPPKPSKEEELLSEIRDILKDKQ